MSRVVAVVVAVGLIVGAILFRQAIDEDDGGTNPEGRPTIEVACAEEVRDACENLGFGARYDIVVEDAALTATGLSVPAGPTVDIWVVPAPWPGIVDDNRVRAGHEPLFDDATVEHVGRSRLGILGPEDLDGCDWRCIGDRVGAGDLRVGGRAAGTALGTLHLGALATGWFGTADFATNDFDGAFTTWLSSAVDAVATDAQPATRLLQSRAFFDAALTFEAEAAPALAAASEDRSAGLALLYPAPVASLDVVVVDVDGALDDAADDLPSSIAAALADRGWQPGSDEPSGLPRPGVLIALGGLL